MNYRKFPRVSYKCRIYVAKKEKKETIETYTENIGEGGICVSLEKPFNIFDHVTLEIFFDGKEEPVSCSGTVVWIVEYHDYRQTGKNKFDTGIEFTDITEKDRVKIAGLVKNILKPKT
ncbi:MAG: PilZ domain-containing protein [Candidatus Omnitrophota bacterium]